MSRAHMLYDNKPLQQEGIKVSKWSSAWNPPEMQKSGPGILLEGTYRKTVKHIIQDTTGKKYRFVIFHIEFKHGAQRKFDSHGQEIEPNFGQSGLVRTGYLHSSYKPEAKGTPDILDFTEVRRRIQTTLVNFVSPAHAGTLCFWGEESTYDHIEIDYGQGVRLKTKGDSPFLESLTKLDTEQKAHSSNYAGGEKAGQSWTDKVMGVKQTSDPPRNLPQDQLEGADDDEWDD